MTNDVKKTLITEVQPVDGRGAPASPRPRKAHHDKQFSSSYQPPNRGRHLGSVGRITRTMKDAVIAAADELGQVDPALWPEHVKGDPGQGMKGFFKTLALKELRTFGVIVARLIPTHVTTHKLPRYVSEEQLKAELREAGLPEDL
jgi:hypothetical protein